MSEQLITLDDVILWTVSQGDGVPVMLCNGGPGCCDYLGPVAAMIDDLVRVYRWEQRGCGRSNPTPPYDHATCQTDLDALRERFGYKKWIIAGHSWGADLALAYALRYPERVSALIYLSGTGIHEEWKPEYKRNLLERGERLPDFAYPFNQEVNREGNRSRRAFLGSPELKERIQALDIPALIIQGGQDIRPFWPAQQVAELLPDARFCVISEAEHYLWLTHPQELRDLLRGFLQEFLSR